MTQNWVNIDSSNGLLPEGTKPLPESMLTHNQQGPMAFIQGHWHKNLKKLSLRQDWKFAFLEWHPYLPETNELIFSHNN